MSTATLHTSQGDIIVELFDDHVPKTVKNFTDLAKKDFYNGTIFHRVIAGFMIQGGCPQGTGTGGPGYKFDDEFHGELNFDRKYLLAMANSGPNTNGSQFFITAAPTTWLNRKHSIFGEVKDEASQKVVDAIETTKTGAGDRPAEAIKINSVTITE
jgi:peptidyl-prolyl cis-trans isomerase A (cyclophilin A)